MAFTIKNKQIQLLQRVEQKLSLLSALCEYNDILTSDEQDEVENVKEELHDLLNQINEKLDKDRAKTWNYIKEKRKEKPEYGRSKYERDLIQKKKDKMS